MLGEVTSSIDPTTKAIVHRFIETEFAKRWILAAVVYYEIYSRRGNKDLTNTMIYIYI